MEAVSRRVRGSGWVRLGVRSRSLGSSWLLMLMRCLSSDPCSLRRPSVLEDGAVSQPRPEHHLRRLSCATVGAVRTLLGAAVGMGTSRLLCSCDFWALSPTDDALKPLEPEPPAHWTSRGSKTEDWERTSHLGSHVYQPSGLSTAELVPSWVWLLKSSSKFAAHVSLSEDGKSAVDGLNQNAHCACFHSSVTASRETLTADGWRTVPPAQPHQPGCACSHRCRTLIYLV